MNLDVRQVGGEILVVSQFTLHASTRKGNRPSYIKAAPEAISRPLYERFAAGVGRALGREVATGEFGADMQVELVNDGPVTIWIDYPTTRMTSVISKIVKDERNRAGLHAEIAESHPIRGYVKDIKSSL